METDSGDLFCVNWNSATSTVYFGCQNTSIQWLSFESVSELPSSASDGGSSSGRSARASSLERVLSESSLRSGIATPPRRVHKFFDSYPQYERKPADLNARNPTCSSRSPSPCLGSSTPSVSSSYDSCVLPNGLQNGHATQALCVPPENMIWSAHYGYVYCMALAPSSNREGSDDPAIGPNTKMQLITGSGDATVKVGVVILKCQKQLTLHRFGHWAKVVHRNCSIHSSVSKALCYPLWSEAISYMPAAKMGMLKYGTLRPRHFYAELSYQR